MVMGASLTKDTKAQPYTTQDRTMHYAPPDFRGSQTSQSASASVRLTHPPIFTCSRSLSPFHSPVCGAHDRDPSIHPYRRHPRPSLDAQPSDPHPGSIPAARRLCHCHPSPGWEIPFRLFETTLLGSSFRWQPRPRPRPRPFPPLLSRSRRSELPPSCCPERSGLRGLSA